jgi:hypothetical protein
LRPFQLIVSHVASSHLCLSVDTCNVFYPVYAFKSDEEGGM